MDRYIDDYEYSFDAFNNERSRRNTLRFCNEWRDFILDITGEDINRSWWEDVPVIARFTYIKSIKSESYRYPGWMKKNTSLKCLSGLTCDRCSTNCCAMKPSHESLKRV